MFSLSKARHLMSSRSEAPRLPASTLRSCLPCTQHLSPETCLPMSALPDYSPFPKSCVHQGMHVPPGAHKNLNNKYLIKDNTIINSGLLKFQYHQVAVCFETLNRE